MSSIRVLSSTDNADKYIHFDDLIKYLDEELKVKQLYEKDCKPSTPAILMNQGAAIQIHDIIRHLNSG